MSRSARIEWLPMDATTKALSVACGGGDYFWRRGTDGRILTAAHESYVLVRVQPSRVADVPQALREELTSKAPAIAERRRGEALVAMCEAVALIEKAERLQAQADEIEAALKAAKEDAR